MGWGILRRKCPATSINIYQKVILQTLRLSGSFICLCGLSEISRLVEKDDPDVVLGKKKFMNCNWNQTMAMLSC